MGYYAIQHVKSGRRSTGSSVVDVYGLTPFREALTQFVEDVTLEIDNNLIENAIRPSALGKKNWLFVGHPKPGNTAQ
jgi:hypothetical protein